MHFVHSMHASSALRRYVRAYAQRTLDTNDAEIVSLVPARLEQTLEFEFGEAFQVCFEGGPCITTPRISVIGPQLQAHASTVMRGRIESFAVFFRPAGFSQIFGVQMPTLLNRNYDASAMLGYPIQRLWNELGDTPAFSERVRACERFLLKQLSSAPGQDRMLEASNRLLDLQGKIKISEVARQEGMGLRHFERMFTNKVGVTPKTYARIARFQTALDMKVRTPAATWLTISHALGYHDQMHMIHEFHGLGGGSPSLVMATLGDMRPDALAANHPHKESTSRIFTMRPPAGGRIIRTS